MKLDNGKINRIDEILNLKPAVFMSYLEDIDENDIEFYKLYKEEFNRIPIHISTITLRENSIRNELAKLAHSTNRFGTTFDLKIAELAMTFSNDEYFNSLAYGNPDKNEAPLSDEKIAVAHNTTVENVIMKKALDRAIAIFELEKENNKSIIK